MTLLSNASGSAANMMLENTTPVMKSTWSRLTLRSNSCRATSGLNWSSLTSTSAGRPPSLPPLSLTASRKPSRMSTPSAEDGPDKVLTNPIRTLSAAPAAAASAARATPAMAFFSLKRRGSLCEFMSVSLLLLWDRTLDPDLQHVIERRLAVEHVHPLQPYPQHPVGATHQRVLVAAAEMAHVVPAQLHHVEARTDPDFIAARRLQRHVADDMVGLPHGNLRPGVWVRHAALADFHHQLVLGEDRRRAFPLRLLGRDRHPVNAVVVEEIHPGLPLLVVQQFGLQVEQLLDLALQVGLAAGAGDDAPGRQGLRCGRRAARRRARQVIGLDRLRARAGGTVAPFDDHVLPEQVFEVGTGTWNRRARAGRILDHGAAPSVVRYCVHARNWLRITASEVP